MDETPLRFDKPGSRTLDTVGESSIKIKTNEAKKRGFTMILTITAHGGKVKPWAIFKVVRDPKVPTNDVMVSCYVKATSTKKVNTRNILLYLINQMGRSFKAVNH